MQKNRVGLECRLMLWSSLYLLRRNTVKSIYIAILAVTSLFLALACEVNEHFHYEREPGGGKQEHEHEGNPEVSVELRGLSSNGAR